MSDRDEMLTYVARLEARMAALETRATDLEWRQRELLIMLLMTGSVDTMSPETRGQFEAALAAARARQPNYHELLRVAYQHAKRDVEQEDAKLRLLLTDFLGVSLPSSL